MYHATGIWYLLQPVCSATINIINVFCNHGPLWTLIVNYQVKLVKSNIGSMISFQASMFVPLKEIVEHVELLLISS